MEAPDPRTLDVGSSDHLFVHTLAEILKITERSQECPLVAMLTGYLECTEARPHSKSKLDILGIRYKRTPIWLNFTADTPGLTGDQG